MKYWPLIKDGAILIILVVFGMRISSILDKRVDKPHEVGPPADLANIKKTETVAPLKPIKAYRKKHVKKYVTPATYKNKKKKVVAVASEKIEPAKTVNAAAIVNESTGETTIEYSSPKHEIGSFDLQYRVFVGAGAFHDKYGTYKPGYEIELDVENDL